jgi:5'-nucleotidase
MPNLKKLVILHSNDMHGDFLAEDQQEKLVGGVSLLSGYINQVREEEKNVIYCIAGDMFRGSIIDSEFKGVSTIEIMNMISPDVVTLGNHETDYGVTHLLFLEKCAKFPIINANMYIKTNHARLFNPYKIIELDGMKVLFIGILTEEVMAQTKGEGIVGTMVNVEAAANEVAKICNAYHSVDIDFTVLLTHIGYEEDKKLAALLDPALGVDVIIGGHSHTFIDQPAVVNNILIAQAGTGTDQIGRFDIMINTDENCVDSYTWRSIPIDTSHCPVDHDIEALLESFKGQTDAKYGRVITRFNRKLTHPSRTMETELGGLLADAMKESLGTDIFLLGSGSIRTESLGPIVTLQSLKEAFPYDDEVYCIYVKGKQFKQMLRYMMRDEVWEGIHCEFYQLSKGLHVEYDRKTHQYYAFDFDGKPIEEEQVYSIGLQGFHYRLYDETFNVKREDIEANRKPRAIATSCCEIIEEYLSTHQHLDRTAGDRLIIH